MTTEGTMIFTLLAIIVAARIGFGRLVVNREDQRRLYNTTKGYLLTTAGTLTVLAVVFSLRFFDPDPWVIRTLSLVLLFILGGYYAFLEWRYIRESRRHVATLLTTIAACAAVGAWMLWMPMA